MNAGNIEIKRKWRDDFTKDIPTFEAEYQTPFWGIIHELSFRVLDAHTTEDDAIRMLLDISGKLIDGVRDGHCVLKDLYYAMKIFNSIEFAYSPGIDLYDFYDGELYGFMECMENCKDIDEITSELQRVTP